MPTNFMKLRRLFKILRHPIYYWESRKFVIPAKATKVDFVKGLGQRNPFIAEIYQERFADFISGPILKVIESAPPIESLFPKGKKSVTIPLVPAYKGNSRHKDGDDWIIHDIA